MSIDTFATRASLRVDDKAFEIFELPALASRGIDIARLPYTIRVLLENQLRFEDGVGVTADDVEAVARYRGDSVPRREITVRPARVLLQDFTGVPALVDLAAMRDAVAELGGAPSRVDPLVPVELVIDHSLQVDAWGSKDAFAANARIQMQRNRERYAFLRWGQQAFQNFAVVPPDTGIVHQINLEKLARVVFTSEDNPKEHAPSAPRAYPDFVVGTDSHTPMVNGLGVLAWGVGGIEAEAAMLGQAISMLLPEVIGIRLEGRLAPGVTATDLVLTITEILRRKGVVGKFVEFFGQGVSSVPVADRATIGNMSPEYGATCAVFPIDDRTLEYLRATGRPSDRVRLVEAYAKRQGLFHDPDAVPSYSDVLTIDLGTIEPSVAGPRRPQDRVPLGGVKRAFAEALPTLRAHGKPAASTKEHALSLLPTNVGVWGEDPPSDASLPPPEVEQQCTVRDGSVVIAAITSCTNTSNPFVMMAAGLLAKKAAARGLQRAPWVKTSLAPGSRVVTDYLDEAGLTPALEALGFHLVGYGCATCIGNSGPLPQDVAARIEEQRLVVCSVLSGNRNFEGRIHSQVRANFLMSPPLVVAYAIAGRIDVDLVNEPLGTGSDGRPVYLRELWPSSDEVATAVAKFVRPESFARRYLDVFRGDERWTSLPSPTGNRYAWDETSTYVRKPPYFDGMSLRPKGRVDDLVGARALLWVGDSVTTDHISPAGSIRAESPAGCFLRGLGVDPQDFNSYGSRRGNHEVMVRGTFANPRIRNRLLPGTEGGISVHLPSMEVSAIYDVAAKYAEENVPLVVLAGKEYGSGSSRDWAAKGPALLGVRAVVAESFERIHRSNLVGMGIVPLQLPHGTSIESLGLDGRERYDVLGLDDALASGTARLRATRDDGSVVEVDVVVRADTPHDAAQLRNGGLLPFVVRSILGVDLGDTSVAASTVAEAPVQPPQEAVEEASLESFPASDAPAY